MSHLAEATVSHLHINPIRLLCVQVTEAWHVLVMWMLLKLGKGLM